MNDIIKKIEAEQLKAEVPEFNVGDTVKVYAKIKEGNRERIQVFEGTVLKKQGGSTRATFTVRKNSNGIGVEKTWPLHSPNVENVCCPFYSIIKKDRHRGANEKIRNQKKQEERIYKENPQWSGMEYADRDCMYHRLCACMVLGTAGQQYWRFDESGAA